MDDGSSGEEQRQGSSWRSTRGSITDMFRAPAAATRVWSRSTSNDSEWSGVAERQAREAPPAYIILISCEQQSSGCGCWQPLSLAAVAVAVAAHAQSEHPCSALAGSSWWLFAVLGATSRRAHQMLWPAQLAVALCHNTPRGHAHGRIEY